MIIAVDFDGTLCTDRFPDIGDPDILLINKLRKLQEEGHKLILWTCRCGESLESAINWCKEYFLEFDAVNDNVEEIKVKYSESGKKVTADIYIDDRVIHPTAFKLLKELL